MKIQAVAGLDAPAKKTARNKPGFVRVLGSAGCRCCQLIVEKIKICRPFKNGKVTEAKKSRPRSVFAYISGLDFFADATDCRFSMA